MSDTIPITIWLAERSYRIRIKAEDEQTVRHAIKLADQQLATLRMKMQGKDEQDFLAMCLLMYAADQAIQNKELTNVQKDTVTQMIAKIDAILEE
ncbi:MAG TPA: cell division protein ZapA [Edaphocola sp.]|nr:cell division protein ZapA [Edaphocola sp.]